MPPLLDGVSPIGRRHRRRHPSHPGRLEVSRSGRSPIAAGASQWAMPEVPRRSADRGFAGFDLSPVVRAVEPHRSRGGRASPGLAIRRYHARAGRGPGPRLLRGASSTAACRVVPRRGNSPRPDMRVRWDRQHHRRLRALCFGTRREPTRAGPPSRRQRSRGASQTELVAVPRRRSEDARAASGGYAERRGLRLERRPSDVPSPSWWA